MRNCRLGLDPSLVIWGRDYRCTLPNTSCVASLARLWNFICCSRHSTISSPDILICSHASTTLNNRKRQQTQYPINVRRVSGDIIVSVYLLFPEAVLPEALRSSSRASKKFLTVSKGLKYICCMFRRRASAWSAGVAICSVNLSRTPLPLSLFSRSPHSHRVKLANYDTTVPRWSLAFECEGYF